ncbi:hypothetical protein CHARACLAT_012112 [Characodon lateralis]|uniref:Uncharacterized protein n=1 Tax=Characodon lateralis TaxID=208331 RepID=A0ABU7E916_9TELE|nr:hypothetical protein [Characodon lateralis]
MVSPIGATPDGIIQSVNLGLECANQSPLLQFKWGQQQLGHGPEGSEAAAAGSQRPAVKGLSGSCRTEDLLFAKCSQRSTPDWSTLQ